jgi:hypothetical protein
MVHAQFEPRLIRIKFSMVTHVHLKNGSVLCLILLSFLFLISGCTLLTATHKTYRYNSFLPPVTSKVHRGDHFTLTWRAEQAAVSLAGSPTQETISAELFGPFSSLDALKQATMQGEIPVNGPPMVASIQPIHTDTWTNKTYAATLHLPQDLALGYYFLVQKVNLSENGNAIVYAGRSELQII